MLVRYPPLLQSRHQQRSGRRSGYGTQTELDAKDEQMLAAAGEFVLEGLYVNNRLSKFDADGKAFFKR